MANPIIPFGTAGGALYEPIGFPVPGALGNDVANSNAAVATAANAGIVADATGAAQGASSLIAGNDGSFNLTPSALIHLRASIAKVLSGVSDQKWIFVGDSNTWGYGTSLVPAAAWPTRLATMISSSICPSYLSFGVPEAAVSVPVVTDTRWTKGANITSIFLGAATFAAYQYNASGAVMTYVPGVFCDTFDVYTAQNTGLGTLAVSVDGGAATNIDTSTSPGTIKKTTIALGSRTNTHSITLTRSGAVTVLLGVEAYDSTVKSIRIANAAVFGSDATQWNQPAAWCSLPLLQAYAADMTFIMLGTNDAYKGLTLASYQTAIQALITQARATGDCVLLTVPPPSPALGYAIPIGSFMAIAKTLAVSNNVPLIDVNSRFIDFATATAQGLMADTVHIGVAGSYDTARVVMDVIRS